MAQSASREGHAAPRTSAESHLNNKHQLGMARAIARRCARALVCQLLLFAWSFSMLSGVSCGTKPSIAIVDEKAFHLEVVGGLMHVLAPYADSTTVYLHPLNFPNRPIDYGFMDLFKKSKVQLRGLPVLSIPHFDILIFVSPEYRIDYVREFIEKSKPKAVVAMIHNGDGPGVPYMPQLHPNLHLITLSPHVANYSAARLKMDIDWMLPLVGYTPTEQCEGSKLGTCLSGFAIQGNMDSRRRNYTLIWNQMEERLDGSAELRRDSRFVINVVGSGDPKKLLYPERLEQRVVPHVGLRFADFYELIYHNMALIPTLASEAYFDRKFSSTVITSLVTGVPVIVPQRFLDCYTFLNKDHVVLQKTVDEPAMDAAVRVLELPTANLAALRTNIAQLREQLNQKAMGQFKRIIEPAMGMEDRGPLPWRA